MISNSALPVMRMVGRLYGSLFSAIAGRRVTVGMGILAPEFHHAYTLPGYVYDPPGTVSAMLLCGSAGCLGRIVVDARGIGVSLGELSSAIVDGMTEYADVRRLGWGYVAHTQEAAKCQA